MRHASFSLLRSIRFLCVLLPLLLFPVAAFAGSNVQSKGNVGIGAHLGYPEDGLSFNLFITGSTSIQVQASVAIHQEWLGISGSVDYLWWPSRLFRWSGSDLTWFWGPGIHFYSWNWQEPATNDSRLGVGFEIPVGLALQFRKIPMDLAFAAVPVLMVVNGGGTHGGLGIAGSLSARWYF